MALYQFPLTVTPNDFKGEELRDDEWVGSQYNNKEFITKLLEDIKNSFEFSAEYINALEFGREEGGIIDFMTDSDGGLGAIFIRIHVGYLKDSLEDIKKMASL